MATPIRTILVATDFSPASACAVDLAADLASRLEARLVIVHAFEEGAYAQPFPGRSLQDHLSEARVELARVVERVRPRVANVEAVLRQGFAWEEICNARKDLGADLVVVGSRGRRVVERLFLGSVAEKVVRRCPAPVLTVHPPEDEAR